jgi:hypothetical protein
VKVHALVKPLSFDVCAKERTREGSELQKRESFFKSTEKGKVTFFWFSKKRRLGFDFPVFNFCFSFAYTSLFIQHFIDLVYMDRLPDEIILRIVGFIATNEWQLLELEKVSRKLRW